MNNTEWIDNFLKVNRFEEVNENKLKQWAEYYV